MTFDRTTIAAYVDGELDLVSAKRLEKAMAEDALNAAIGGFLLSLVLFILARVFRLGAEMRSDLEGTI